MKLEFKAGYNEIIGKRYKDINFVILICLVVLSLFPIFNYIRLIYIVGVDRSVWDVVVSGQVVFNVFEFVVLFDTWRDYCFMVVPLFLVLILFFWFKDIFHKPFLSRIKEALKKNISFIFLIIFAIWITVMTFVNGVDYNSVIGHDKSNDGLLCYLCFIGYFTSAFFFNNENFRRFWVYSLMFASSVINLLILLDRYAFGLTVNVADGSMVFYNSNDLSAWQMMCALASLMMFLLNDKKSIRIPAVISWCMGIAGLIFSNTLGAIVAVIAATVFAGIVMKLTGRKRNISYLLAILLALITFIALYLIPCAGTSVKKMTNSNTGALSEATESLDNLEEADPSIGSGRYKLWAAALKSIVKHPITGVGITKMQYTLYEAAGNGTVHNEFLDYAMTYGIPALVLYIAFMLSVYIRGAKHRKELTDFNIMGLVVAFGYLVGSFFSYTIFYTTPVMCIFLGFGYYRSADIEKGDTTDET